MKSKRSIDLMAGLLFIAIAAIILWFAIPYGVKEPKKIKYAALSPSYYPRIVGYILLLFGAFITGSQLLKNRSSKEDSEGEAWRQNRHLVLVGVALTLFVYYLCLEPLGFVLASAVALLVLLLLAGEKKPLALILIPLILPLSLHLFFTHVANIPIPAGILQSILVGG